MEGRKDRWVRSVREWAGRAGGEYQEGGVGRRGMVGRQDSGATRYFQLLVECRACLAPQWPSVLRCLTSALRASLMVTLPDLGRATRSF